MASWIIDSEQDCNFFSWKIHGVSNILNAAKYIVTSPLFTYGGTSWTIKLFPNGDSQQNEGHISVTVERSDEQGLVYCCFYCKDISNEQHHLRSTALLSSEKKVSIPRLMSNLKDISEDSQIVIDDTFCLVLQLQMYKTSSMECSFPTKSAAETVGSTEGNENVVGEIIKEYEGCKFFSYTVSDIPRGLSSDYHTESPPFSFLNATWISKLRPHYRMQNSQNQNLEIVLERIESEIPVHHVEVQIDDWCGFFSSQQKTITFTPSQTQTPAFSFQLHKPDVSQLRFWIEIRALKTTNVLLEPQNKSFEEDPVDDDKPESSTMSLKYKILEDYKKLFFDKEDCDVHFTVKGQELLAHKVILKVRSPVLASALRHEMKEKVTGIINIEDCEPSHFSDFLYFLYCGEVENLATENVFSLFTLADKYQVLDLKTVCLDFMKRNLTVDTFCETISLALLHCEAGLVKLSTEFFAKNIKDILVTVKWQSFICENPIHANELLIKATEINSDEAR